MASLPDGRATLGIADDASASGSRIRRWWQRRSSSTTPARGEHSRGFLTYDKAAQVRFGCDGKAAFPPSGEGLARLGQLQRDLASTSYWSGRCVVDYVFFACNWHPLVGILFSHPYHPWTKTARFAVLLMSSSLTMLPLLLKREILTQRRPEGMYVDLAIIYVYATLPVTVFGVVLYNVFVLEMHFKDRCTWISCGRGCVKQAYQCCLCGCLYFSLLICMFVGALCAYYANLEGGDEGVKALLLGVVASQIQSWLIWFPLYFMMPYRGFLHMWCMERRIALA